MDRRTLPAAAAEWRSARRRLCDNLRASPKGRTGAALGSNRMMARMASFRKAMERQSLLTKRRNRCQLNQLWIDSRAGSRGQKPRCVPPPERSGGFHHRSSISRGACRRSCSGPRDSPGRQGRGLQLDYPSRSPFPQGRRSAEGRIWAKVEDLLGTAPSAKAGIDTVGSRHRYHRYHDRGC